jgi:PTS system mannose-specific IIA component
MIGMILVTHGDLAKHFVDAMQHVVGNQEGVSSVCIGPNDDIEKRRKEISAAIKSVDRGKGVIVLTDLFGGTPSNLAISLLERGNVEVIAGINLPMLIRLAGARKTMSVTEAVSAAKQAGRNYITVASEFLGDDAKPEKARA